MTHICVSKLSIIGSDNGLSPGRRQAIIWTNAGILIIRTLGTNFSEISSEIHAFSFKKMHLKKSSANWRPYCLGLNVLKTDIHLELVTAICSHPFQTKCISSSWKPNNSIIAPMDNTLIVSVPVFFTVNLLELIAFVTNDVNASSYDCKQYWIATARVYDEKLIKQYNFVNG